MALSLLLRICYLCIGLVIGFTVTLKEKDRFNCKSVYYLTIFPQELPRLNDILSLFPCAELDSNSSEHLYTFKGGDKLKTESFNGTVYKVPKKLCVNCLDNKMSKTDKIILGSVLGGILVISVFLTAGLVALMVYVRAGQRQR